MSYAYAGSVTNSEWIITKHLSTWSRVLAEVLRYSNSPHFMKP